MSLRGLAACASMLFVSGLAAKAEASAPTLKIEYQVDMGRYGSHDYVYIEGTMTGSVSRTSGPAGSYTAPFVMAYPKDGGNHIAYVDVPEDSWFILWRSPTTGEVVVCGRGSWEVNLGGPFPCETGVPQGSRLEEQIVTNGLKAQEGYLFREGYTYFSVQYAKTVTDFMGPNTPDGTPRRRLAYGTIEKGFDGDEILKDGSRILRTPNLTGVPAATHVLAYAFSAAGIRMQGFLDTLQNGGPGSLIFDGMIITNNGMMSWINTEDAPVYADILFPGKPTTNGAKVIRIDMEADMLGTGGMFARDPNYGCTAAGVPDASCQGPADSDYVRWEIAGTAHLTPLIDDLQHMGATRQNPIDRFPIDRGAMAALKKWVVDGIAPPPTSHLSGQPDLTTNTCTDASMCASGQCNVAGTCYGDPSTTCTIDAQCGTGGTCNPSPSMCEPTYAWIPDLDAEGNALGGVRLPHMRRYDAAGADTGAGAPTGVYGGAETNINNINVFLGGTYEAFSAEKLAELYPTEEAYRTRYNKAAQLLRDEGYILEEDYQRYIAAPQMPPVITDPPDDPGDTGCCSTARSKPPVATFGLFLAACLLGRANRRRRRH